jgi:hypothetical protein
MTTLNTIRDRCCYCLRLLSGTLRFRCLVLAVSLGLLLYGVACFTSGRYYERNLRSELRASMWESIADGWSRVVSYDRAFNAKPLRQARALPIVAQEVKQ